MSFETDRRTPNGEKPLILTLMSKPPFVALPSAVTVVDLPHGCATGLLAEPAGDHTGNVVLVPGFTGSKEDFIAVLEPLAELGWRTLAVDLPGQNGAPALGGPGSHSTAALAKTVAMAADWLGPEPVHLVGHSMGGLITRATVLAAPTRIASWVPLCSGPSTIPAHRWPELTALRAALAGAVPLAAIWEQNRKAERDAGQAEPPREVLAFLHTRFLANDPHALADCALLLMTEPDRTEELRDLLQGADAPEISVVTGVADDVWSVEVQQQLAADLGVRWVEVAGCGHSPAAENPIGTATALHGVFSRATRR